MDKRVLGGEGRYLNISLRGCPELIKIFLFIGGRVDFEEDSRSVSDASAKYVGFVSQENVGYRAASPNIARGNGCCGIIVPEGSVSPGRMCIGKVAAISLRVEARFKTG